MNKRIKSFGYAGKGISTVIKSETNMKIHLIMMILVVICGFLFTISTTEWLFCILSFGVVIAAEMINTAIENVVNLISPAQNELAGKAKDMAAGAVLICAIASAIIGLIIFVPKGLVLLFSLF